MLTGSGTVSGAQYFVQDIFGNVRGTVYDSVNTAQVITYSDWGEPDVTGDQTNRLGWKGLSYDEDLGLTYVRARWYDPAVGRFVSEDPLGLSAGINPYLFADDDPVNGFDPSGMVPINGQEVPDWVIQEILNAAQGGGVEITDDGQLIFGDGTTFDISIPKSWQSRCR